MLTDLFYYYGIVFILKIIYGFFERIKKEDLDVNVNEITSVDQGMSILKKRFKFSTIFVLLDLLWMFMGFFSDQSSIFWFLFFINMIFFVKTTIDYTKKGLTPELNKIYIIWSVLQGLLIEFILYKHFQPIYFK